MTGVAASVGQSMRKLSEFALQYEQKHGKIYCPQREENQLRREEQKRTRVLDTIIQDAWKASDCGQSFRAALAERGYELALNGSRIVAVDPEGTIRNPVRHIEGIGSKEFRARLAGLDLQKLPDLTSLQPSREDHFKQEERMTRYRDLDIEEAWKASRKGEEFQKALRKKGYELARGRKRTVVVDPYGKIHNPLRHIEGVRTKDFDQRLFDVDTAALPDAEELSREIEKRGRAEDSRALQYQENTGEILAAMEDRQFRETTELSREHGRELERERTHLSDTYQLEAQEAQIKALRHKASRSGVWSKVVAMVTRVKKQLSEKEKSLENAKWRFN